MDKKHFNSFSASCSKSNNRHADIIWKFDQICSQSPYIDQPRQSSENGQMKLLMSEIELFWLVGMFLPENKNKKVLVVYVGSAPGNHFPILFRIAKTVNNHCEFHLFDPTRHSPKVGELAKQYPKLIFINEREFVPEDVGMFAKFDGIRILVDDVRNTPNKHIKRAEGPNSFIIMSDQKHINKSVTLSQKMGVFDFFFIKRREPFYNKSKKYPIIYFPKETFQILQVKCKSQSTERRDFIIAPRHKDYEITNTFTHDQKDDNRWVVLDIIPIINKPITFVRFTSENAIQVEEKMHYYNSELRKDNQPRLIHFILSSMPKPVLLELLDMAIELRANITNRDKNADIFAIDLLDKLLDRKDVKMISPELTKSLDNLYFHDRTDKKVYKKSLVEKTHRSMSEMEGSPLLYLMMDSLIRPFNRK